MAPDYFPSACRFHAQRPGAAVRDEPLALEEADHRDGIVVTSANNVKSVIYL